MDSYRLFLLPLLVEEVAVVADVGVLATRIWKTGAGADNANTADG